MNSVVQWVLGMVGDPTTFIAVAVILAIGGTITVLPTQSLVVAVTTLLAAHGDVPFGPMLLFVAATVGMVAGDLFTFWLVRVVRVDRIPFLNGDSVSALRVSTRERLEANPGPILITGRFIPMGRILTNVAASDAGMSLGRFAKLSTVGGTAWAAYSIAIGSIAGVWAERFPVTMVIVAVVVSILLGYVFQRLEAWYTRRRQARAQ